MLMEKMLVPHFYACFNDFHKIINMYLVKHLVNSVYPMKSYCKACACDFLKKMCLEIEFWLIIFYSISTGVSQHNTGQSDP